MSLNVKKVMEHIFYQILSYSFLYDDYEVDDDLMNQIRYIKGDQNDFEWLAESKLDSMVLQYLPTSKSLILKKDDICYLVICCEYAISELPHNLTYFTPNNGLISSAIYHSGVMIKSDIRKNIIYNDIAFQYEGIESYSGHDLSDILNVLTNVNIFELNKYTHNDLLSTTGSILALNRNQNILKFNDAIFDQFAMLFEYGAKAIPFQNLLNALLATSYKHSFFELYKCIESLYQVVFILELYKSTKPSCSLIDFLDSTENTLRWRPFEKTSASKIFSQTPTNIIDMFKEANGNKASTANSLSEWFYETRNRIVHLRQLQKKVQFDNAKWEKLIFATLRLIEYWYNKFKSELNAASDNMYYTITPSSGNGYNPRSSLSHS